MAPTAFVVNTLHRRQLWWFAKNEVSLVSSLLRGVAEKTGFAILHNAIIGRAVTDHQVPLGGSANQTVCGWNECHCMDTLAAKTVTVGRGQSVVRPRNWRMPCEAPLEVFMRTSTVVHAAKCHASMWGRAQDQRGPQVDRSSHVALLRGATARGLCEDLPILLTELVSAPFGTWTFGERVKTHDLVLWCHPCGSTVD